MRPHTTSGGAGTTWIDTARFEARFERQDLENRLARPKALDGNAVDRDAVLFGRLPLVLLQDALVRVRLRRVGAAGVCSADVQHEEAESRASCHFSFVKKKNFPCSFHKWVRYQIPASSAKPSHVLRKPPMPTCRPQKKTCAASSTLLWQAQPPAWKARAHQLRAHIKQGVCAREGGRRAHVRKVERTRCMRVAVRAADHAVDLVAVLLVRLRDRLVPFLEALRRVADVSGRSSKQHLVWRTRVNRAAAPVVQPAFGRRRQT